MNKEFKQELKIQMFGKLAGYAAVYDINLFNKMLDKHSCLADEFVRKRLKRLESVELPPEFGSLEYTEKMLNQIHKKIEGRASEKK